MYFTRDYARNKKVKFFFDKKLKPEQNVLEIGSGSVWTKSILIDKYKVNYTDIDIEPPAQIVADIKDWKSTELIAESFDAVVAFEVVEHVDCLQEVGDLLKPGGYAFLTTPMPHFDWLLKILELLKFNQKRTSPHDNLVYLKKVIPSSFKIEEIIYPFGIGQWAILQKK